MESNTPNPSQPNAPLGQKPGSGSSTTNKLKLNTTWKYMTVGGVMVVTTLSGIFLYNREDVPTDPAPIEAPAAPTPASNANTIEMDGLDDFLEVDHHPDLAGGRTYTIESWIYPTAKKLGGIVSKRKDSESNTSYSFLVAPVRGALRVFFKVNKEDDDFYSNDEIPLNEWTHVAAVFDGNDDEFQRKRIYINGKLSKKGKSESRKVNQFRTLFGIGMLLGNSVSNFSGKLDEVRFWNRALSEEEIRGHMCQVLEGSESGLLGYWRFDGGTGSTVRNYSQLQGLDANFNNMEPDEVWIDSPACPELDWSMEPVTTAR
ncbi:MAG: LamG domain-containing protein [Salibacteraceae bacterium]